MLSVVSWVVRFRHGRAEGGVSHELLGRASWFERGTTWLRSVPHSKTRLPVSAPLARAEAAAAEPHCVGKLPLRRTGTGAELGWAWPVGTNGVQSCWRVRFAVAPVRLSRLSQMTSVKRVLLISYDFPPTGGSGVQRPTKFAKYLPKYGWRPVVLTTRRGRPVARDPSLLEDVGDVEVHRTPAPNPDRTLKRLRKMFARPDGVDAELVAAEPRRVGPWNPRAWLVPDAKVFWIPFGLAWAARVARNDRADLVLSTIPSPSVAILGWRIARMWGVPHVVDYRDRWAGGFHIPQRIRPLEAFELSLEREILAHASAAVVVRDEELSTIRRLVPDRNLPVEIIMNGYDESDFEGVRPQRPVGGFVIAHVGVLYQCRDLGGLVNALKILATREPHLLRQVHFVQVGTVAFFARQQLAEMEKIVRVSVVPQVPHPEAIGYMLGADLLCLPTYDNAVPGKTFEYLRAGRPILGIGDDAPSLREILTPLRRGEVFTRDDAAGVGRYLKRIMRDGSRVEPADIEALTVFSREAGVERLAALLDRILDGAATSSQ